MSRPTSEPGAVLVGHGVGATPPQALVGAKPRHAWLDAGMSITLLAPPGADFDDEAAVLAWASRAWQEFGMPGDEAVAPEPVAWRAGRRGLAAVGVTWPAPELAVLPASLRSVAPLWAGVVGHALAQLPLQNPCRLVVAEGRSITIIDIDQAAPSRWARLALADDDAALLDQVQQHAAGPVWLAGHSLPGDPPAPLRLVPGLGPISQPAAALMASLRNVEGVEPALRRTPLMSRRLGIALVATATAVLALAARPAWEAHDAWRGAQARAEARAQVAVLHERERQRLRAQQARGHQRLLQPWAQRFAAAEVAQPADGGWLKLEQRRDNPTLLLVGEAATPGDALAVARRVSALQGVEEARVLRSERVGTQGRSRFELGVRLAEARP